MNTVTNTASKSGATTHTCGAASEATGSSGAGSSVGHQRVAGEKHYGAEGHSTPSDFGHRNPDYNGDGNITEQEARVFDTQTRSDTQKYQTDSRGQIAMHRDEIRSKVDILKEEGKNYRAEVTSRTEAIKSQNDNKIHKITGKSPGNHSVPLMPTRPSADDKNV